MNVDVKLFELRDRGTLIPWVAFRWAHPMSGRERALLMRAGFGEMPEESDCVIQGPAACSGSEPDDRLIYNAGYRENRRMALAAHWIAEHFAELKSGQVVDVRVILGEQAEPATSEISDRWGR